MKFVRHRERASRNSQTFASSLYRLPAVLKSSQVKFVRHRERASRKQPDIVRWFGRNAITPNNLHRGSQTRQAGRHEQACGIKFGLDLTYIVSPLLLFVIVFVLRRHHHPSRILSSLVFELVRNQSDINGAEYPHPNVFCCR